MHTFIIGTTFVITYMIARSCFFKHIRKYYEDEEEDFSISDIHEKNPFSLYESNSELLQFFSKKNNHYKLQRVLDLENGIFDKTLKLIENNEEIKNDYTQTQEFWGEKYFHHTYQIPILIEIRDTIFKTSFGQLNYIKWLILNDYFLHIE